MVQVLAEPKWLEVGSEAILPRPFAVRLAHVRLRTACIRDRQTEAGQSGATG